MRRVRETIVAVEKQKGLRIAVCMNARVGVRAYCVCGCVGVCMCLGACRLAHAACNAHAPYCHLRRFWLHHIFDIISKMARFSEEYY